MKTYLAFVAAMLMLPTVYAASANTNSPVVEKPLVAQSLESFNRESARIREQMQPGGVYEFIKAADRARVETRLADMQKLLQDHSADGDMSKSNKIALVNAQEEVNGILRHNDNNRMVCESRAPVGSHIPVTTCRTYGEVEQQRRDSVKSVGDMNNTARQRGNGGH